MSALAAGSRQFRGLLRPTSGGGLTIDVLFLVVAAGEGRAAGWERGVVAGRACPQGHTLCASLPPPPFQHDPAAGVPPLPCATSRRPASGTQSRTTASPRAGCCGSAQQGDGRARRAVADGTRRRHGWGAAGCAMASQPTNALPALAHSRVLGHSGDAIHDRGPALQEAVPAPGGGRRAGQAGVRLNPRVRVLSSSWPRMRRQPCRHSCWEVT